MSIRKAREHFNRACAIDSAAGKRDALSAAYISMLEVAQSMKMQDEAARITPRNRDLFDLTNRLRTMSNPLFPYMPHTSSALYEEVYGLFKEATADRNNVDVNKIRQVRRLLRSRLFEVIDDGVHTPYANNAHLTASMVNDVNKQCEDIEFNLWMVIRPVVKSSVRKTLVTSRDLFANVTALVDIAKLRKGLDYEFNFVGASEVRFNAYREENDALIEMIMSLSDMLGRYNPYTLHADHYVEFLDDAYMQFVLLAGTSSWQDMRPLAELMMWMFPDGKDDFRSLDLDTWTRTMLIHATNLASMIAALSLPGSTRDAERTELITDAFRNLLQIFKEDRPSGTSLSKDDIISAYNEIAYHKTLEEDEALNLTIPGEYYCSVDSAFNHILNDAGLFAMQNEEPSETGMRKIQELFDRFDDDGTHRVTTTTDNLVGLMFSVFDL